MAGSINKVILVGNLGKDPEVRATQDGKEICTLTLATSDTWKDKQTGERKEKTEWHRVVIFNDGLVNVAKNYLRKGSKIYVEGALQTRKWVDQSGAERYSTEVVLQAYNGNLTMLDNKPQGEHSGGGYSQSASSAPSGMGGGSKSSAPIDDEIPF